jgi:signal transduction histidine kinase
MTLAIDGNDLGQSSQPEGATPLGQKVIIQPNWKRLTLTYFTLAAVEVAAVCGSLYLAQSTQREFEDAARIVERGDQIAHKAFELSDATVDLAAPANTVFETHNYAASRELLASASAKLDAVLQAPVSLPGETDEKTVASRPVDQPMMTEMMDSLHNQESVVREIKSDVVKEAELAISLLEQGQLASATEHMSRSNTGIRALFKEITTINSDSNHRVDKAVQHSDDVFRQSLLFHYLMALGILLMVGLISSFAYVLGKMLRSKYGEIARAHGEETRLSGALRESLAQLKQMQDEALRKSKMAQLGQLTATVAHEIRNPLGAMRTATFVAKRKNKDDTITPQLDRVENGITRCDDIITQLLDFSRAAAANKKPVGLDDWLAKTMQETAESLPASVTISLDLGLGSREVPCDEERLRRALVNLVNNASEAMVGKDGSRAGANAGDPQITVSTRTNARGVVISVADNGPGMAADVLSRIREPLFTTKSFGTGLGVPAVEKIAEQHGGGLDIESEPGRGATSSLWLPLENPKKMAA